MVSQLIEPMGDDVVMEDLDEALAGEGRTVDLGRVIGAEEGVGGLADDAVDRLDGQTAKLELHGTGGGAPWNKNVGDDGVGARRADNRSGFAFCFPANMPVPMVGGKFSKPFLMAGEFRDVEGIVRGGH